MKKTIAVINVWFDDRGFGFCHESVGKSVVRYFLHIANVVHGTPIQDAVVRFDPATSTKGPLALNAEVFQSQLEMKQLDDAAAFVVSTVLSGGAQ
jgi:cold shock CspA family protein